MKVDFNLNKYKRIFTKLKSFNNAFQYDINENDTSIVVTKNGTIMYDFTKQSNIRDIKKIACIGDSVAKGSRAKVNYGKMLANKLSAKVTNFAVSGSTMSTVKENSIFEQASQVRNAELVILQGTDDDWLFNNFHGVTIGHDKTDLNSFYGAFYQAVKILMRNNEDVKIIVLTATRQLPVNEKGYRRKDTDKNNLGFTLEDYVNAQVLACTELKVPVFDAYHTNLFDPYNPAFRMKNMIDGLHPNELGHEVIMYELIKNYYYFYG